MPGEKGFRRYSLALGAGAQETSRKPQAAETLASKPRTSSAGCRWGRGPGWEPGRPTSCASQSRVEGA